MRFRVYVISFLFFVFFFPHQLFAQTDTIPIYKGIDKFILGAPKSVYISELGSVSGGTFTWNDTTTTTYEYCPTADIPVLINGVPFRFLMLTFNEQNQLFSFEFVNRYTDRPSTPFLKRTLAGNSRKAVIDHKALIQYLNEKCQRQGREKVYDKSSYYSTHEWKVDGSVMKLTLQRSKFKPRDIISIGIYLQAMPE